MERDRDRLAGTRPELPARRGIVRRQGLLELLSSAPSGCVVLVCAPAGSGKTELVLSWVEAKDLGERIAWVGVDRGEQDAQHFWLAVIHALADATGREELVEGVHPAPNFRGEPVVERLLAGLDSLSEPLVLVIDDLHELSSSQALALLDLFVARLPARLRLVLASREEPRLGLHRLRLAGRLTEIRDPDLRFSLEEARELLEGSGIELPEEALVRLHERTEGWAAGLRLAVISLARHPNPERFVSEFSGSERTVAGYLMAEVLDRQPPEVRELLLRTSILDRVSGPLADSLTGGSCSERILQELEDANAFVSSLDATRSWFRYHHLFADLLQLELRRTDPASIDSLHRKAARWHEQHGDPVEAIRHAQAAEDWGHAARLLTDSYVSLFLDGRRATVSGLLAGFPPETTDPELAIALAGAGLFDRRPEEVTSYIDLAERQAGTVPDERRSLFQLRVAYTKLWEAGRRGDLSEAREAMRAVEEAVAAQPADRLPQLAEHRVAALTTIGVVELWTGEVADAVRHLEEARELARRIERPYQEIGALAHLGVAMRMNGETFANGLRLLEQAVALAEAHGWADDPIEGAPALAFLGSELVCLGRFEEAELHLVRAERALAREGAHLTELVVRYAGGMLRFGQGRLEDALAAFRQTERMRALLSEDVIIDPRGRIVQVWARMGETAPARATLDELSPQERDSAFGRTVVAQILLAEDSPEQAVDALAPVIEGSSEVFWQVDSRTESIEALLYDATARDALGDARAAEATLERALELAEPEGIILPFALAPVKGLLERHPRHRTAHANLVSEILDVLAGSSAARRAEGPPLLDELSEAELRVIRYLPSNLKAPEIAAELFVSPNTVRTHLRHIYSKLEVHSRGEAVERARELGLVAPSSRLR
jgi:LuxR family transcriptional regulator, maltose regulon positive regulatory protein